MSPASYSALCSARRRYPSAWWQRPESQFIVAEGVNMKNMRVVTKLALGFGFTVALMLIMAVIGITRLSGLNDEVEVMINDRFPKVAALTEIADSLNVIARAMRNSLLVSKPEDVQQELDRIPAERKAIGERLDALAKVVTLEAGKEKLK